MANAWLLKHLLCRGHEVAQNCKLWLFLKKWWPGRYKYELTILYSANILSPEIFLNFDGGGILKYLHTHNEIAWEWDLRPNMKFTIYMHMVHTA